MADVIGLAGLEETGKFLAGQLTERHVPFQIYEGDAGDGDAPGNQAGSLEALASNCNLILIHMAGLFRKNPQDADLWLSHIRPGTLVVDVSDGHPRETQERGRKLESVGGQLLDVSLIGSHPPPFEARGMMVLAGGWASDFARALPYLQYFTEPQHIYHMGGLGSGHAMKAVCNLMNAYSRWITVEGLALASRLGMPPERVIELVALGTGRNYANQEWLPRYLSGGGGALEGAATLGEVERLLQTAVSLGRELKVPMTGAIALKNLYQQLSLTHGSDEPADALMDVYEQWAGIKR